MPFESIPNERKSQVTIGLRCALAIMSNITQSKVLLDTMVRLQYSFVHHILSLPTINKYLLPLLFPDNHQDDLLRTLNLKNLFQSYFYSKQVDDEQTSEKEEVKGGGSSDSVIGELSKNEAKMFIFANTFEMLNTKVITKQTVDNYELYPIL